MECSFVVGQKVVCSVGFDFFNHGSTAHIPRPIKGKCYTIRGIESNEFGNFILHLEEITDTVFKSPIGLRSLGWFHYHFRPLQDTTKQVEALKRLATDLPWNFDPDPNPRERVDG